jgi:hypothetical protein
MNEKDIFKEQLKSVFSDFEAPVPPDGWEKVEQSLNTIRRAKIIRQNWYVGSAAATVAIILGSLFFLNSPHPVKPDLPVFTEKLATENTGNIDTQNAQIAKTEKTKKESNEDGQVGYSLQKQEALVAGYTKRKQKVLPVNTDLEQTPENIVIAEQTVEVKVEAMGERIIHREESQMVQPSQEEIDRLIQEFENAGKATVFEGLALEEKKSKPIMLAMNAKGGLTSSQKTVNSPMTLRSASAVKPSENGDGLYSGLTGSNRMYADYNSIPFNNRSIADNIAEMEHDQPVSFGITVSKTIVDRLSVETGLVYTYLFSRAKNTSVDFQNQETQHFHYLGIPINLNYNFVNIGKLGLFASFGGMVEKDVYGEFRSTGQSVSSELNSTSQGMITTKISQKNPQVSVSAGVGMFYPIYGGFNLYGKVGGAYYFDARNSEYKTIYTDKKIVFDLNAGVRFDF